MWLPGWVPGAGNNVEISPTGSDGSGWRLIKKGAA